PGPCPGCFLNGTGDHFKGIGPFIESLNDDSLAIVKANKLFKDPKLLGQLAFIKGNFTQLVRAISSLQERLPLTESIGILEMRDMELEDDPKLPFLFLCTPITSVDCERVFSELNLTERHVKYLLILQWNND
ncbi:Uncharacterized protein FKW44_007318, partial [Caligus rogercresseyi]